MGNYPAYPAYQDSGIPWLGDIPAHWEVKKAKHLVSKIGSGKTPSGGSQTYIDSGIMLIRSQNVYDDGLRLDDVVYISDQADSQQAGSRVLPDDILLNITGASIGRTSLVPKTFVPANVNQHVCIFRPSRGMVLPEFFHLLLCSAPAKFQIQSAENGTSREGLNFVQAGNLTFGLPPLAEQRAIARFLDYKTAQIDALIAKKQALLAALAEKRRALITHAVTRGLDPAAPLRDSGVPWLGEIPAHWEAMRLRFRLSVNPSKREVRLSGDSYVSFVPMEAVGEYGGLDLSIEKSIDEIGSGYTFFTDGDIVVAKITPCFENGKGAIATGLVNGIAFGTTELHVLRPGSSMCARFVFYLTISSLFRKLGEAFMYGAGGQKRIPDSFIKNLKIGIPPLTEQRAIAHYLDQMSRRMAEQTERIHAAIAALREYRAALITHAVTGQIDVRGLPLSPEPE